MVDHDRRQPLEGCTRKSLRRELDVPQEKNPMTTPEQHIAIIRFQDLSPAAAGQAAEELQRNLLRSARGMTTIDLRKDRPDTQDFGATLVLALGTPAALAIAKGIHDFISKHGHRVTITTEHGEIIATGDGAKNIDVAQTVKALEQS
jgi:hypothetical protein